MRKALIVFSVILAICVVALLAWANWPVPSETLTNQLHLVSPETWSVEDTVKVNATKFDYTVIYPKTMKTGQSSRYQLVLDGLPNKIIADNQTWQLQIHSELLLPGFINESEGRITQTVQMDTPLRYRWDIMANEERNTQATLNTSIEYRSALGRSEPLLLSVTSLTLNSTSFLGLSTGGVNSLAVAFLLLSGLAGSLGLTRPHE